MIDFKRVNRGRIVCTAGLLAIFLAGGPVWAGEQGSQGSKGKKGNTQCLVNADCKDGYRCTSDGKCKNAKDFCSADADCGDGSFCKLKENKCHKKDKDFCRADADCGDGFFCKEKENKCHKKDKDFCQTDADCGDGFFCKEKENKCHKKDKNYCASDADCGDGFYCKEDDNKCHKKDKNYCASDEDCQEGFYCKEDDNKCHKDDRKCAADSDCRADEVCGQDGKCHQDDPSCESDSDCKAGERCGDDRQCHTQNASCDDANPCTIDKVTDGVCGHIPISGCAACDTAADCDDTNACTTDICTKKSTCDHVTVDGCARCAAATDCDDADACTSEQCGADGSCQITVDPTCEPAAPQAAEICGDCIDNNNDGLTDFEDPSCCSNPVFTMNLVKARLLTKKGGTKLSLGSALLPPTLTGVNALDHDIYVQIRPVQGGDVLCARIPAQSFKRAGKTIRFSSRNSLVNAQGIKRVVLKLRKRGFARVRIVGKEMPMGHLQQGPMQLTLGFYNAQLGNEQTRCASTMASFRSSKKALVAP